MTDLLDTHLGNYRLVRLLGKGGFASVYLAEHRYLNTLAAIKVMDTHLADEQIAPFQQEARTIAHLVHPHIVRVLEYGVEAGMPYLVMDYAAAGTLRSRHPRGTRLPLAQTLPYVQQIAAALGYAHQQRLIHRDIKPENILLGREDHLWLSDFGLAIVAQSSNALPIEQVAGTLSYISPEQLQGKPRPASDQYALAIMVYEWLNGRPPFLGTNIEVIMQHMTAAPPPLSGVPPSVQDVLMTALAKDPSQRFPDVQVFAATLQQASEKIIAFAPAPPLSQAAPAPEDAQPQQHPPGAPPAAPLSQFPTRHLPPANPAPLTPPAPHPPRPPKPWGRPQPRRWLMGVAALLLILLVSSLLLLPRAPFWGTSSPASGALMPPTTAGPTTAGNNPSTPTLPPGLTSTPSAASTASTPGATSTAGNAPPTATTGTAPPTAAATGNPSPTPPGPSPTPTTSPAALVAAPLSLSFSLTLVTCLLQAPSKTVTLQNQGGFPASWQANIENPAYLSVAPTSGRLASGQSSQITVTVICPKLTLNTVDHITITWSGTPITITITLSIL